MAGTVVPSGVPIFADYATYDSASGLFVGLSIKNLTDNTAETSPSAMVEQTAGNGIYQGQTPSLVDGKQYSIIRRVFIDVGLTIKDLSRAPVSDNVYASAYLAQIAAFSASVKAVAAGSGMLGTVQTSVLSASIQTPQFIATIEFPEALL